MAQGREEGFVVCDCEGYPHKYTNGEHGWYSYDYSPQDRYAKVVYHNLTNARGTTVGEFSNVRYVKRLEHGWLYSKES